MQVGSDAAPAGGARNPTPREASGRRPSPLRGTVLQWAGRGADEGGRKPAGSGRAQPSRPRPEVTAPGTEIAAVERREARLRRHGGDAPRQACRAASPAARGLAPSPRVFRRSAPSRGAQIGRRPTRGRQEYGRFCARASPSPGGIRKNAVLRWPLLFGYIRALSRSG